MEVKNFFDHGTFTLTYVVWDTKSKEAILIDPVLDYDPLQSKVSESSSEEILNFLRKENLKLHFILETHAHADHLSGAQIYKREFPMAKLAIGGRIREVQKTFKEIFNLSEKFKIDGSQFDLLLDDKQVIKVGSLEIKVLFTPGHTPACVSYLIGDAVFTGDALFMPDSGTGRCDFPNGSAEKLYDSIHERLYSLPDKTKIYVGHDYMPQGRALQYVSTIGEEKERNVHLRASTSREEYVKARMARDKTLSPPKLLYQSLQVNINAGHLPDSEGAGQRFLKLPLLSS